MTSGTALVLSYSSRTDLARGGRGILGQNRQFWELISGPVEAANVRSICILSDRFNTSYNSFFQGISTVRGYHGLPRILETSQSISHVADTYYFLSMFTVGVGSHCRRRGATVTPYTDIRTSTSPV